MTYRTKAQNDEKKQKTQVNSTHFPFVRVNNHPAYWNLVGSSITEALAEFQRYLESMELKKKLEEDLKINNVSEKKTKV